MSSAAAAAGVQRADRLGLLYQHILTVVVRIQAGKQSISDVETFRRRVKGALEQAEREAGTAGYDLSEIRDTSFAVVALLDETILSSKAPKSDEWQKRPLTNELFGQAVAGDVFFDRLLETERRSDSPHLIDVLEVYLLCLLLGFEGRFAPPLRGEAYRIMDRLRRRIETFRRSDYKLSPPLELRLEAPAPRPQTTWPWYWWAACGMLAAAILFIVYWLNLSGRVADLRSAVDGVR
jgi:type VI secretion system protein ImpK